MPTCTRFCAPRTGETPADERPRPTSAGEPDECCPRWTAATAMDRSRHGPAPMFVRQARRGGIRGGSLIAREARESWEGRPPAVLTMSPRGQLQPQHGLVSLELPCASTDHRKLDARFIEHPPAQLCPASGPSHPGLGPIDRRVWMQLSSAHAFAELLILLASRRQPTNRAPLRVPDDCDLSRQIDTREKAPPADLRARNRRRWRPDSRALPERGRHEKPRSAPALGESRQEGGPSRTPASCPIPSRLHMIVGVGDLPRRIWGAPA